eukprot:TRINITY_DN267_c0_g1_i1.p1 TRINITY_DN267_c0_g1~~TRINITY_DN267_c0_g1_i1.p1  ORF type:complete len:196 (-),score=29.43 TRINITY_DN267_c0_g1_i1:265-852(-)
MSLKKPNKSSSHHMETIEDFEFVISWTNSTFAATFLCTTQQALNRVREMQYPWLIKVKVLRAFNNNHQDQNNPQVGAISLHGHDTNDPRGDKFETTGAKYSEKGVLTVWFRNKKDRDDLAETRHITLKEQYRTWYLLKPYELLRSPDTFKVEISGWAPKSDKEIDKFTDFLPRTQEVGYFLYPNGKSRGLPPQYI